MVDPMRDLTPDEQRHLTELAARIDALMAEHAADVELRSELEARMSEAWERITEMRRERVATVAALKADNVRSYQIANAANMSKQRVSAIAPDRD